MTTKYHCHRCIVAIYLCAIKVRLPFSRKSNLLYSVTQRKLEWTHTQHKCSALTCGTTVDLVSFKHISCDKRKSYKLFDTVEKVGRVASDLMPLAERDTGRERVKSCSWFTRVIDCDGFDVHVVEDTFFTQFTAMTGFFVTTERCVGAQSEPCVNPNSSGSHLLRVLE